jgi:WD40 repeat protein
VVTVSEWSIPDGARVFTAIAAGEGGTARVWEAATGRPLTPPLAHAGGVLSWAFSPDGARVVTANGDGTARVWDLAPDDRPAADLVGLSELLSGHRIDDTGAAVPLPADELARLWADLRARYPAELAVAPQSVRWWRERQIRDAVKAGDVRAAQFHYWALVAELASGRAK